MTPSRCCLLALLIFGTSGAQSPPSAPSAPKDPPMSLQEIADTFADPDIGAENIPLITRAIERNGIDFAFDQDALERVLDASIKGGRSYQLTASLILQLLRACADCRLRYFGPLTREELYSLLSRKLPPHIVREEVRLRGTKDIPRTPETIRELTLAGAQPDLVNLVVPDDELMVAAPAGFSRLNLVRSQDYSRSHVTGRLFVRAEVIGRVEFLFVNNALFYRALANADKKGPESKGAFLSGTYNSPSPSTKVEVGFESASRSDNQRSRFVKMVEGGRSVIAKGIPAPTVEFAPNLVSGRGGFRIVINEPDRKQMHTYEIQLRWVPPRP